MTNYIVDLLFVLVMAATTYFVARKLFVDVAILFVSILISTQLSIGTFEAITFWIQERFFLLTDAFITIYFWFLILVGMFFAVAFLLYFFAKAIFPNAMEVSEIYETYGCWVTGVVTGYLVASFLITALHTLPTNRDFWGAFPVEVKNRKSPIAAIAPDYQFLALSNFLCEYSLPTQKKIRFYKMQSSSQQPRIGRLQSFPIRYAEWREELEFIRLEELDALGIEKKSRLEESLLYE